MRYLTHHQLLKEKGVPHSLRHLRREWSKGRFPVPQKLFGKTLLWPEPEVDAWLASQPRADEKAA